MVTIKQLNSVETIMYLITGNNMEIQNSTPLTECLCCGSKYLNTILDLGEQPLANSFLDNPDEAEDAYPLKLNLCGDCTHLQLSDAVNPDLLFKHYLYVSGTSKTLRDYFSWFAKQSLQYFSSPPKVVLDIACNDGSQLDAFKSAGLTTYGIDPAENLHALSSKNHNVICDYFTPKHIPFLASNKIDIINAQNVFAHINNPLEFLTNCKDIMHDESVLFIQTSQADMVVNNEFDTIYHEHLSFFNSQSMSALAKRAGLHLIDILKTPIHGTSYVFVFSKHPANPDLVNQQLKIEFNAGLDDVSTYYTYAKKCKKVLEDLKIVINQLREDGYAVVGYGAAAKGNTLLNSGDIILDYIIDDNPLKQGKYTPGTRIPVVSVDALDIDSDEKIAFVPLAWNFFTEIKRNIKRVRDNDKDVFVTYFPTVTVTQ